jgi:hypothetical protein
VSDTDGICLIGGHSTADCFLRGQRWQTLQQEMIGYRHLSILSVFTDGIQPSTRRASMAISLLLA